MTNDLADRALVVRCLNGDPAAFGILLDRYQKLLFNLALRMVGDWDDAEDITQTAFIKAYEGLARFDPKYRFFSWIYRITVNESLNLLKSRKPRDEVRLDMRGKGKTPEGDCQQKELEELVGSAVRALPVQYCEVIILRHFLQLSYREMSEIIGIPQKTVKSRLYSARQKLASVLSPADLAEA